MKVAFSSDTRSSDCWSVAGECGNRVESRLWHAEMIAAECEVVFFENGVVVKGVERVVRVLVAGDSVGLRRAE